MSLGQMLELDRDRWTGWSLPTNHIMVKMILTLMLLPQAKQETLVASVAEHNLLDLVFTTQLDKFWTINKSLKDLELALD